MIGSSQRRWLVASVVLVALFVVALPAGASYTKLFRFKNETGGDRWNVRAILGGLEVITGQYTGLNYPWLADGVPVEGAVGLQLISGVYSSTIFYGGTSTRIVDGQVV